MGSFETRATFSEEACRQVSRTEYFDDPNAPAPNVIVAAASAVVVSADHKILLQKRIDNDLWSLPGGAMELGESIVQTTIREVKEESGLHAELDSSSPSVSLAA